MNFWETSLLNAVRAAKITDWTFIISAITQGMKIIQVVLGF